MKRTVEIWQPSGKITDASIINVSGPWDQIEGGYEYSLLAMRQCGTVNGWGELFDPDSWRNDFPVEFPIEGVGHMAVGCRHAILTMQDGTFQPLGSNDCGQLSIPESLQGKVRQTAAGDLHTILLLRDGNVACFGTDASCEPPSHLRDVQAVSMRRHHAAALCADGSICCWGGNSFGQCTPPRNTKPAVQVTTGAYHTAALLCDGQVVCWGGNMHGQCDVPDQLNGVRQIASDGTLNAALTATGELVCWGDPFYPAETFSGPFSYVSICSGRVNTIAYR